LDCSQLSSAYRRPALSTCVAFSTNCRQRVDSRDSRPVRESHRAYCRSLLVRVASGLSMRSIGRFRKPPAVATIGATHFSDGSSYEGEIPRPCGHAVQIWLHWCPVAFRLPPPIVRRDSGEWIALGRNRVRGYQRVTGRVEASALRALPVDVLVQVIVPRPASVASAESG
jgi:hypothetical protein